MTTISVLGLGAMGSALAGALIKAGHTVTVWNRTQSRVQPLMTLGARGAATPGEAVAASELVVVCLLDYASVEAVLAGAEKALSGRVVANLTTGTPKQARSLATWVEAQEATYVDGGIMAVPPMIGTPQSFIFYSGSEPAFERHKAAFELFGDAFFVGPDAGLAPLNDIALLGILDGLLSGYLHAAALIRASGGSAEAFTPLAVRWAGSMASLFPDLARQIDRGDYRAEGGSNLAMQAAAMDQMVEAARDEGVDPIFIEPMRTLIHRRVTDGFGTDDSAGVIELLFLNGRGKRNTAA
ncbi:6-phosphogluconate dehydrogenase [Devosia nitrariae]|uniref:6-phosphogluconate dehydrogenase n=1 Tax=Devosia nitrariae TaxID=2071872 RepID=A0ABQ5W019_9HYPH|nr:NAD(P)-binding domain-containing protein [Devosia nitrariae]GLQ53101.1 6-phosphogluconate dehydrogenase [Devosia nitrariae]